MGGQQNPQVRRVSIVCFACKLANEVNPSGVELNHRKRNFKHGQYSGHGLTERAETHDDDGIL